MSNGSSQEAQPVRQVTYIPPDPDVIKAYTREICAEFEQQNAAYGQQEVVTGLTAFLTFVAQTTAKYLNRGHQNFLLKGYKKRLKRKQGAYDVTEKTIPSKTS